MAYDDTTTIDEPAAADARPARERPDGPMADAPMADAPTVEPPAREREKQRTEPTAPQGRDAAARGDDDKGSTPPETKKKRPVWLWLVLLIVIAAAIVGGVLWWLSARNLESTDDAYTDGRAITIANKVTGYVVDLRVNDNQFVHAGDVILQIDPRDYVAARDQAQASLETAQGQLAAARANAEVARATYPARLASARAQKQAAEATLTQRQADYRRQTSISRAATTQQNIDEATASQRQATANVAQSDASIAEAMPVEQYFAQADAQVTQLEGQVGQAKAQLDRAVINLGETKIVAPQDGWVTKRNVEKGNYLQAGTSVMSLVSPQVWVTANFKETQLDRLRPGQHVDISVDAYPSLALKGHVDSVQLGSGSKFTAFPAENATGNYVKIVQRVPVKIDIDSGMDPNLPLPLGISVVPTVTVK